MKTRWIFRSLAGPAFLVYCCGCVAPAPYGGYPGYYGPPRYMAPSPGVITSPGPAPYPSPQLGPPLPPGSGSSNWSPTPATPPTPGGNSTFSPTPSNKPADNLPPNYPEIPPGTGPGLSPTPQAPQPGDQNSTPFGAEGGSTFDNSRGGAQMPVRKPNGAAEESYASRGQDAAPPGASAEPFEPPVERGSHADPQVIPAAGQSPARGGGDAANPYDYDRASYSWLRGVVDYDARDKTWQIIYNPKPDRHDRYGGALCLGDHPKLKDLHDGDFVYVEGHINQQHPDTRGKACYEIDGGQLTPIRYTGPRSVAN
jgi:hypothetical protein